MDFVTGLPSSEHNTTILTTVDRFSEAVHFVPLAKLPSVLETAHLLIAPGLSLTFGGRSVRLW